MTIMLQRIWAVLQKELIQTLRDWRTLLIQLSIPMIQLFLFGYAISMNVRHIPTVVADQSLDASSLAYVQALEVSGYFDAVKYVPDQTALMGAMDAGIAQAGIFIPPDFAAQVARGDGQVLLLVDGSDIFTSQSAYNAATAVSQNYATDLLLQKMTRAGQINEEQSLLPLTTSARILYNPNLDDLWFLIPGMLAMLLQMQTVTLTATAVVREREVGTIEQLLVTPIRPFELMIGKMIPNILVAFVNLLTIVGLGVYWFGVPFQGDFGLFLWLVLLFIFSGLGLGLLVSTISQTQKQTLQLISLITLVGTVLGGFIFPRYTMPRWIYLIGYIFPMTHFIPIARGVVTKGVGIEFLWEQVAALAIYVVVILVIAARAFRERLD